MAHEGFLFRAIRFQQNVYIDRFINYSVRIILARAKLLVQALLLRIVLHSDLFSWFKVTASDNTLIIHCSFVDSYVSIFLYVIGHSFNLKIIDKLPVQTPH